MAKKRHVPHKSEYDDDEEVVIKKPSSSKQRKKQLRNLSIFLFFVTAFVVVLTFSVAINSISDKEALRESGITAYNSGNYEKAVSDFSESLIQQQWFSSRMDFDTKLYLADSYMRLENYSRANVLYKELVEEKSILTDSKYLESMENLSSALNSFTVDKDFEATAARLKPAVDGGNARLALQLSACYGELGKYDEMQRYLTVYTNEYGFNTYTLYQSSTYYLDIDDLDTAERLIDLKDQCEDNLYRDRLDFNHVILLEKKHEWQGAFDEMKLLHSTYPDNEEYEREYDFLYTRVNIDPVPVNPDANYTTETEEDSTGESE